MRSAGGPSSCMDDVRLIDVEVAYAQPDCQVIVALRVPEGTSAEDAVRRSGLMRRFPGIDPAVNDLGVFGRRVSPRAPLSAGDRVEIYRPLVIDPKEARRRRAARSHKS
jgi:putative ubiquitin-RnfH superfamily antitoxin RatB of RatAB toxin-antitoxin module